MDRLEREDCQGQLEESEKREIEDLKVNFYNLNHCHSYQYRSFIGVQGNPGRDGLPGIAGRKGEIGYTGMKGEAGLSGPIGFQGEKGDQGECERNFSKDIFYITTHLKGFPGPSGLNGIPGMKGDKVIKFVLIVEVLVEVFNIALKNSMKN